MGQEPDREHSLEWLRLREAFLGKNRYCSTCWLEGEMVEATEVDRFIPKRLGGPDDETNLQALCQRHYISKLMRESVR